MTKSICAAILFCITFLFNQFSYSYNSFSDISDYVEGRVVDVRHFPVPFVKVIIAGKEVETDKFGKFKITDVPSSYNATIAEKSTATAVTYKGLSIRNPQLILFGKPNPRNANSAIINIKFPEIPNGSSAVIKFISSNVFYCEDVEAMSGETGKTIIVYWPVSEQSLTGNVIYLQKTSTSYQGYQDIPASLYVNAVPFNIRFLPDSQTNTRTSNLTVFLPFNDFKVKGYSVFADFSSYNRNSEVLLNKQSGNIFETKSIIPTTLPVSYRLRVSGFADYSDGSGFINSTYSKPGATINLQQEDPPQLQTPSDKLLGANGNTEFYYSLGSGTGIFVVEYHSFFPVMNFYIVTYERSVNLDYLARDEFKNAGSVEFKWSTKKYLTYFSVNDFVKQQAEFNNDVTYKAVLYSTERTFKTGYY